MIKVTCALIRNEDGKLLVVQRGKDSDHPYKWEFPGGKVQHNETYEESIIREIEEELSLEIIITGSLNNVNHDYGTRQICLIPFMCETLLDLPVLKEHIGYRWVEAKDLSEIDFCEADIPVAMQYMSSFSADKISTPHKQVAGDKVDEEGIREMLGGKAGFASIDLLTESAIENRSILRVLMSYALGNDSTLAFRAAYTLQKVAETDGLLLKPYHKEIVQSMPELKNESVIRSFLKIINMAGAGDLDQDDQGILADCSFKWLNDSESAIAIKAFSMEALYYLTSLYPELAIELVASINQNMEEGSAGVKARGSQILKKLAQDRAK